ncbi:MAG: dUTP diphosphatase [Myxococcales bacterium]|nr:dUTP diphosphatase [Myxococcales bacterium]
MPLQLRRLDPRATLPKRMSAGAAGLDLFSCLPPGETMRLEPGARALVPTGWAPAIAPGYEGQVRPRSGLALRQGLTVLNAPGTIDADYRGELRVLLVNLGSEPVIIEHGMRVAQLVIAPVAMVEVVEVEILPEHDPGAVEARGSGGFGSTGR